MGASGHLAEDLVPILSRLPRDIALIALIADPTGEVEVLLQDFTLLNPADHKMMPFLPSDAQNIANEELRTRFRHLDLRRQPLTNNLRRRSRVAQAMRFLEVETPVLLKSTPEGAREFLVPTRLVQQNDNGEKVPQFYSLAQSPQQPKQLLICSGAVDKYFQIARCFRDEDGRKDRQPEFTQVDMEMAFVSWGDKSVAIDAADGWRIGGQEVRRTVEVLLRRVWTTLEDESADLTLRFPVMTYAEAMDRFGSDKPDTRFGLEISNMTPLLPKDARDNVLSERDIIECIVVRGADKAFTEASKAYQAERLGAVEAIRVTEDNLTSWLHNSAILQTMPISIPESTESSFLNEKLRINSGDCVWLSRRKATAEGGATALGKVRLHIAQLAEELGTYTPPSKPHFLWVTEFPLFTRADDDKDFLAKGRWSSTHHPFTAPMWQDVEKLHNGDFASIRGQHYDLVLNGVEIGGGSVRIHDPNMQEHIFTDVLQLTETEKASFNHLLHALRCGAPPHGGIALGFDRIMAMLCGTDTIRDVIAFPKTGAGTDAFFKSPSTVNDDVLAQYGIKTI
ncbi:hypothetical protein EW145_g594 [Phellinidium pouzarii]|uniref:Aminoacyl-transfer RNA synthetases class-II family profile domain-containing protein n=1 Tax=Phellinidium pouzarii TaxID=167371 RepID=A0A4S4LHZ3_9AGAM|nr:hypothetical protein EW145_g594 [Phellinidium pouzarii]